MGWSARGSCKNTTVPSVKHGVCMPSLPCVCQNVSISNCSFSANAAKKNGGAIYNQWSTFAIADSVCAGNTAGGKSNSVKTDGAVTNTSHSPSCS